MSNMSRILSTALLLTTTTVQLTAQSGIDRSKRPTSGAPVTLRFPKVERRTLSNGIAVALLENHELPIASVQVIVEARGILDPSDKDGLAIVLGQMLSEGTTSMTADQLAEAFADLGNNVSPTFFTTVTANVDRSLALMADMLMHPAFPAKSLDRIRANEMASIKRLRDQPGYVATRVFNNAVYGTGHPYERVRTDESLTALTRDDLVGFHSTYYRPQNVTIVLAGDLKPKDALAKLETAFGGWPKGGKKTVYDIPAPKAAAATTIYLFDRPNSPQSVIYVGQVGPRRDSPDYYATELLNAGLGGIFNSRLNLNLREKHAYTYGANSGFTYRRAPEVGAFSASAQVVTPKTDSALIELVNELKEIRDARPITAAELELARASQTLSLPLRFEALNSMAGAVAGILRDNLPADYYDQFSAHMAKVSVADATDAARKYLDPAHMAIVVVGDRKLIEAALRATKIAPVVIVDEHAKPIVVP